MSSLINTEVGKSFCSFSGEASVKLFVPLSLLLLLVTAILVSRFFSLGQVSKLLCPLLYKSVLLKEFGTCIFACNCLYKSL